MILRTVHMHFRPEAVPEFMALFETHREAIAAQPGCRGVHLIQSPDSPERLGTVSIWDSASDLDAYRHSALFGAAGQPPLVNVPPPPPGPSGGSD